MAAYGIRIWGGDGRLWLDTDDLLVRMVDSFPVTYQSGSRSISGINQENSGFVLVPTYRDVDLDFGKIGSLDYFRLRSGRVEWQMTNQGDRQDKQDFGYAFIFRIK